MRLKKLNIHNIASIADATIDFDGNVLAQEPIFLICGKTGSGKTTLLDAICLALYNDTPRMKQSPNESYYVQTAQQGRDEDIKENKINDVRQLMRRNTGEACVTLSFEGNDGKDYETKWSVRRAHGNPTGNLRNVEWTLTGGESQKVLERRKEVEQKIKEVVGLNFDQFCRSVLLPQGEFTRFLKGKEEDKAGILETITGLGIYSEIGKEIYSIYSEKEKAYNTQKDRLSGITLLNDEEKAALQDEVNKKTDETNRYDTSIREARTKKVWLEKDKQLADGEAEKEKLLEKAKEQQSSEATKAKQADVNDWTATADARLYINQIDSLKEEEQSNGKTEEGYIDTFRHLLGDNQLMEEGIEKMGTEQSKLEQFLKESEPSREMYENSQTIVARIENVVNEQKKAAECRNKAEATKEQLQQKSEELSGKEAVLETKKEENEKVQQDINAKNAALMRMDLEKLQTMASTLSEEERNLDRANTSLGDLKNKQEAAKTVTENRQATEKKCSNEQDKLKELDKEWKEAETALKTAEEAYNKQKTATEDYVKELRHNLHEGELCPVCGQKIERIETDEHFQSLLEPLDTMRRERKEKYDEVRNSRGQCIANLESLQLLLPQSQKEEKTAKAQADKALQAAKEACEIISIFLDEENLNTTIAAINNRIDENNKKKGTNDKKLKQANELQKEINGLQQDKNKLQKTVDDMSQEMTKLRSERQKIETNINNLNDRASNHEEEATQTLKEVMPQITYTTGDLSPQAIIDRLKSDVDNYNNKKERRDNLDKERTAKTNEMNSIEANKQQIITDFPNWDREATTPMHPKNIVEEWINLCINATKLKEKISSTQSQLEDYQSKLSEFYNNNPNIDEVHLRRLSSLSQQDIEKLQKEIDQIKDNVTSAIANLNTARQQKAEHQENKPQLAEEDNIESLGESIARMEASKNKCNQEIGAKRNQLDQDRKNAERFKAEEERLCTMRNEWEKWKKLKDIFGSADGKTFRKIAQSFVLHNLLFYANNFLGSFTPRYRMECQAGSLTILLSDAYQGGALRSASTLSGGESFLVSLSLALGLSSLGTQGRSTDFLFIDEGFGTLSNDYLDTVMNALEHLHNIAGKKVGIISHVDELRERIKTQIQLQSDKNDNSRSQVVVIRAD